MKTFNTYYENYTGLDGFIKQNLINTGNKEVLVQVFSGICDKDHLLSISEQIRQLIPTAKVLMTTTSGEIMDGLVSGLKTAISFSVFDNCRARSIFAARTDHDDFELGQSIAACTSSEKDRVLILFTTGLNINSCKLLQGIESVNPHLPVAGGSAGANRTNGQYLVGCNNDITEHGAAGVVLEGEDLIVNRYSHLGWQPIGKEMTVTRAEGARVYTIDNIPAYQVYHKYLGITADSNIFKVVEFPLIIGRHGINIARAPFLRYDDDSIGFFGDIDEGEKVRFGFGHVEVILDQIGSLLRKIKQHPVESIFIFSCASRRGFLQESAQIETRPLQALAPTAGFFTSGEFFHNEGSNQLLNTTMTTLILSESTDSYPETGQETFDDTGRQSGVLPAEIIDNVADRSLEILKALTFLVETVTDELHRRTDELQNMNEQIQYAGSHDALTGLYNRSHFNQAVQELECQSPGFIMCDVDGLKFINDSFGHSQGDTVIKVTAGILQAIFGPDDVVARIGGDEFAVLLPNTTSDHMEQACQQIREAVEAYNIDQPTILLSLSVGFACHDGQSADMNSLLTEADNKMYWEKLHHRTQNNSDMVRALIRTLEERDIVTEEHGANLQNIFIALDMDQDFPQCNLTDLFTFARFHDIGKIGISDQVITKKDPLNMEERTELEKHCEIGYRIARSMPELHPVADWVLKHHEWWNGEGYPLGLKGEEIPLECRILAILDAYDDMTSRQGISCEAALQEIDRCSGIQFDPLLAACFIAKMRSMPQKNKKTRGRATWGQHSV